MQSKAVLQSTAFGVDHASHESEKTCVTQISINEEGVMTVEDIKIIPMQREKVDQFIIYDDLEMEREIDGQKIIVGKYIKTDDQVLYNLLRKEGCSPEEAHTAILLTGSKGIRKSAFDAVSVSTPKYERDSFYGQKKVLPHYHGRRRF